MKSKKLRIIICSGGTGGHLFPSQAITESLLNICNLKANKNTINYYLIDFITDKRSLKYLDNINKDVSIKIIYTRQFSGKGIMLKMISLFFIGIGFIQSIWNFILNKPKVVVAFGGYVTVPVLIAAVVLKIPIVLHEQNAILGRANKLFIKYAKVIATSFEITLGLSKYKNKVKFTGLPVRKKIINAVNTISSNKKYFTISILGGSQGANIFGSFIPKAFSLLPLTIQQRLLVYHQCRIELLNEVLLEWKQVNSRVIAAPFFVDIAQILLESDLIISRSGASTIAEINCFGKPALYIPFTQAILNHQVINAEAMLNLGAAEIILEEDLNFDKFNDIIISLLDNKSKRDVMSISAKKACKLEAVDHLTSIIINLAMNKYAKF